MTTPSKDYRKKFTIHMDAGETKFPPKIAIRVRMQTTGKEHGLAVFFDQEAVVSCEGEN